SRSPSGFVHATPFAGNKKRPQGAFFCFWRRGCDSNPRYGNTVNRISNPAHSTTLPPLQDVGARCRGSTRGHAVRHVPEARLAVLGLTVRSWPSRLIKSDRADRQS